MLEYAEQQSVYDFHLFPPVGENEWQYGFGTAAARSREIDLLSRAFLVDLASAENYDAAVDMLSSTQYAMPQGNKSLSDLEKILMEKRAEARRFFKSVIPDLDLANFINVREDFRNIRLALRRKLTDKPLGSDYSDGGTIDAEDFSVIFEEEDYTHLPYYMREAIEKAVLAYYDEKDVRQIDISLDQSETDYRLKKAKELGNRFHIELVKMNIDLTNIRTMFRLRLTEPAGRDVFLQGGHLPVYKLRHCIDLGEEAIPPLFYATPYYDIVEEGVTYYENNKSFLKLEAACEHHVLGYLKSTNVITAGPQPVISYLLRIENEIRKIRLIMTAKKNYLDTVLILDRLGE